jgi:hypothetical protein
MAKKKPAQDESVESLIDRALEEPSHEKKPKNEVSKPIVKTSHKKFNKFEKGNS